MKEVSPYERIVNHNDRYITSKIDNLSDDMWYLLPYSLNIQKRKNPHSSSLFKLKEAYQNLQYNEAEGLALKILDSLDQHSLVYFEIAKDLSRIYDMTYAPRKKRDLLVSKTTSATWGEGFIEQEKYLAALKIEVDLLQSGYESLESMSALSYGLHLIEHSSYEHLRKKAEFLYSLGSIQLNERAEGLDTVAIKNLKEASNLFTELNLFNLAAFCEINILNVLIDKAEPSIVLEKLDSINGSLNNLNPLGEYYYLMNKGFINYVDSDNHSAIIDFKNAMKIIEEPCSRLAFDLCYYIGESYLEINELDSAEVYLKKAKKFEKCGAIFNSLINFYTTDLESGLTSKTQGVTANSVIDLLLKRRNSAKELFANEAEYHLGDFYVQNCHDILSVIVEGGVSFQNSDSISLLTTLMLDTKQRGIKLREKQNVGAQNPENYQLQLKIRKLLHKVSDFKNRDFSDNAYSELYLAYKQLGFTDKEGNQESGSHKSLSFASSPNLIIFSAYQNRVVVLAYEGGKILVNSNSRNTIKDLTNILVSSIENKEAVLDGINDLKKVLGLPGSPDSLVLISPDVELNFVPFDLIFPQSARWIINHSPYSIEPVRLSSSNAKILSYSDEKTQRTHSEKTYVELTHGLEECTILSEILTGSSLFSGPKFTKKEFLKNENLDILHLSTHSSSMAEKRQECFIVCRDSSQSMLDSIYSWEISGYENSPTFVSLGTCDSGIGAHLSGEGIYSLSRAFLSNGTETVLKTIWKIDDEASKHFMVKFYKQWLTGISVLEAQYQAKKYMRDSTEFSHPYYWAGFVLEGNPNLYLN